MFRKLYILFFILFVVCATSCDKGLSNLEPTEDDVVTVEHIMTKGNGDGKVYLFGLVGIPNTDTKDVVNQTALYCDLDEELPLVPGTYDGSSFDENSENGLRAKSGDYKLYIMYPYNVPLNQAEGTYEGYDGLGKWGYLVYRESPGSGDAYFAEGVDVTLKGVYLGLKGQPSQYVFNANDMQLKHQRSQVTVEIARGENVGDVKLNSFSIVDIPAQALYNPAENVFYCDQDPNRVNLTSEILHDPETKEPLGLSTAYSTLGTVDFISMNYNGEYVGIAQPKLQFKIKQGDVEKVLNAPLGLRFDPQYTYEMKISIESSLVRIQVNASGWTGVEPPTSFVDSHQSLEFAFKDDDWTDVVISDSVGQ